LASRKEPFAEHKGVRLGLDQSENVGIFGLETGLTQNATKVNTNCLLFGSNSQHLTLWSGGIFCMVLIVEAINYVHCKIK
jgi:hypothetical protein